MMTKPDLIKVLIKEYDNLIEHLFKYVDKYDYHEDCQLHMKQGRVTAFKECIIGNSEENIVHIKATDAEISKILNDEKNKKQNQKKASNR